MHQSILKGGRRGAVKSFSRGIPSCAWKDICILHYFITVSFGALGSIRVSRWVRTHHLSPLLLILDFRRELY
jgi:hypothetical protein